ncbi:MAG: sigma-70 family RNA polymerase sigma factor [Prolixibacteraceae bacterium]|nr:sigma-70 family RNA polymerase sigma factor [Prolixibacteraceae bacterium]MBN2775772.1 sigma-70 family RNA polymerase sigma factor [Prolixibacteraceae bacterium]
MGQKKHIHQDIIEDCKSGDNKARYKLYQLYSKAMFNVCYRMMHNREEAEDMLQEAFTLAFRKLDTFRYESGFGSWMKRIVVNTCLNAINKRKPELVYCEDIYQNDRMEEEEKEIEFSVENVKKAMEELPDGGRMIFSLYLFEGYDHGEIAQIMGITESTSKSQFMRAKRKIIEILKTQNIWS